MLICLFLFVTNTSPSSLIQQMSSPTTRPNIWQEQSEDLASICLCKRTSRLNNRYKRNKEKRIFTSRPAFSFFSPQSIHRWQAFFLRVENKGSGRDRWWQHTFTQNSRNKIQCERHLGHSITLNVFMQDRSTQRIMLFASTQYRSRALVTESC